MPSTPVQMAFATAAFVVNDRDRFRTFFRTTPSFEFLSPSLAVLMERFNWTQLAVVTQDEDLFTGVWTSNPADACW